jgi:RNA polymerase sigma factor (sigma-70 family)
MAEPEQKLQRAEDRTAGDAPIECTAEVLSRLLIEERPRLEGLVRRRMPRALRDRESAADLVQSICGDLLRANTVFEYRGLPQFNKWLDAVVCNKVNQRLRRAISKKRDVRRLVLLGESELDAARPGTDSPAAAAFRQEELSLLDRALARLPEETRDLLVRRHFRGHSHQRIAHDLGIASGLNNRIARAKAQLAAILDRMTRGERAAP